MPSHLHIYFWIDLHLKPTLFQMEYCFCLCTSNHASHNSTHIPHKNYSHSHSLNTLLNTLCTFLALENTQLNIWMYLYHYSTRSHLHQLHTYFPHCCNHLNRSHIFRSHYIKCNWIFHNQENIIIWRRCCIVGGIDWNSLLNPCTISSQFGNPSTSHRAIFTQASTLNNFHYCISFPHKLSKLPDTQHMYLHHWDMNPTYIHYSNSAISNKITTPANSYNYLLFL